MRLFLSKERWGQCLSAGLPGNSCANLMSIPTVTGNLPFPSRSRDFTMSCQTCKNPLAIKPSMSLSLTLGSSVMKLGRHRACRPAGCSLTLRFVSVFQRFSSESWGVSGNWCKSNFYMCIFQVTKTIPILSSGISISCGAGYRCSLDLIPSPGDFHIPWVWQKKEKNSHHIMG